MEGPLETEEGSVVSSGPALPLVTEVGLGPKVGSDTFLPILHAVLSHREVCRVPEGGELMPLSLCCSLALMRACAGSRSWPGGEGPLTLLPSGPPTALRVAPELSLFYGLQSTVPAV
jgi:hypothetical protein